MSGTFEIYEDAAGRFRFRLTTGSGEVVATSHGYTTKDSAIRGCRSIAKAAHGARVVATAGATGVAAGLPSQRNDAGEPLDGSRSPTHSDVDPSAGAAEDGPVERRFRFAAGMSADGDLATRSGDILRDELRHDR